jgi:rhodanese-related sulfurtransferase
MAGMLYDSLHTKLMPLGDSVEVYPAHGAGSMCGRNISKDTSSTIGAQKRFNYALQPMTKSAFITMMTTDLPEAPAYFSKDAELNRTGAKTLAGNTRPSGLTAADVKEKSEAGAMILDVRPSAQFGNGHVPGALNIGLSGQFASWAGSLLDMTTPIVVVAEDTEGVDEAVMRLARVGIETTVGYLQGGMYAWDRAGFPIATVAQMPIDELNHLLAEGSDITLLDVRRPAEFKAGHVPQAKSVELAHLADLTADINREDRVVVMCQSGYRSAAACSLLQKHGFKYVTNVVGGMSAWNALQATSTENTPAAAVHA